MLTLLHHPFCPHSRFVRLALAEHGLEHHAIEERVWERREEFLMLNPAATTPVLVAEGYPPVPGVATIAVNAQSTTALSRKSQARMLDPYLLVHQEYSPTTAMQGVRPYVRTVADASATE